jgi:hypothetical protein
METIRYRDGTIAVREVARPDGWSCRVLVAEDGRAYLEYLVSVGPYKIDVAVVHPLSREDFAAFEAGTLDLGVLARNLAEHDMATGAFERRE